LLQLSPTITQNIAKDFIYSFKTHRLVSYLICYHVVIPHAQQVFSALSRFISADMFRFVLLLVLVAATTAFVVPVARTVRSSNGLFMALQTEEVKAGPFDWIAAFFFPLTATKEMDMAKVESNPPRFKKGTTSSGKKQWAQDDAAAAFTAKYVPVSWQKRQVYMNNLDARDRSNLGDEVRSITTVSCSVPTLHSTLPLTLSLNPPFNTCQITW
jgi:hypothetical protein